MKYSTQQLNGLIDLVVEAELREIEMELKRESGAESGQEQRRRGDGTSESLPANSATDKAA